MSMANAPTSQQLKNLYNQIAMTIIELRKQRKFLKQKNEEVCERWRDGAALRISIISDSSVAEIMKVENQLKETANYLKQLYFAVKKYEEVELSLGGNNSVVTTHESTVSTVNANNSAAKAETINQAAESTKTESGFSADGSYIGSYRKYQEQTEGSFSDYRKWKLADERGKLPYRNLNERDGNYHSVVSAQDVFGVFDNERSDFWTYKRTPKEDYIRMATYIPLVRAYLDEGKTIEEVAEMGGITGACAYYYFIDAVRVMKAGKAYIHCGDGRHRTVAAQIAHVELPVRVVREYELPL